MLVYAQRVKEAYPGIPVVIGSIEASLRRVAHYDYWSDKVRRSVLPDSKADLLVYGNAERAIGRVVSPAGRRVRKSNRSAICVERLSWYRKAGNRQKNGAKWIPPGWIHRGRSENIPIPIIRNRNRVRPSQAGKRAIQRRLSGKAGSACRLKANGQSVVRLPSFEQVKDDPVLYAHASRVMHLESNPGNARALVQAHGERDVWLNPPPLPLTMEEMDGVYGLPYARAPHPAYRGERIPAWEMIRFSVNIMRGCFGGCTFCSITEHEGRIIQSRSEPSILREIEEIRDHVEGFTGVISDLGGPSANMYRLGCKNEKAQQVCRRLSCVYPEICKNLDTDHGKLISLYRKARALPGIRKILIGSGVRYDLAVRSPEYIRELVTHHVGGLLKIAPEHTEPNVLSKMMKPGIGTYDAFKKLFDRYSREAGKEQYLVPYFIAAHPGATDEDMLNLALWLKKNRFRPDQVQTFMPTPMAIASTMYHTGKNPLEPVSRDSERVETAKKGQVRRLHKAFLRYHDPENWQLLREWLRRHGRSDLIGNGPGQLVPAWKSAPVPLMDRFASSRKPGQSKRAEPGKNKLAAQSPRAQQGDGKKGQFGRASRHRKGFLSVQDVDGHDYPGGPERPNCFFFLQCSHDWKKEYFAHCTVSAEFFAGRCAGWTRSLSGRVSPGKKLDAG